MRLRREQAGGRRRRLHRQVLFDEARRPDVDELVRARQALEEATSSEDGA